MSAFFSMGGVPMQPLLNSGERIDSLLSYSTRIIQSSQVFCFSLDAVLLAEFTLTHKKDCVVDLGTGTGAVPLLLTHKQYPPRKIHALEIQPELADMAARSVAMNGLGHVIAVKCADLRDHSLLPASGCADVVTCNPPYEKHGSGKTSKEGKIRLARHEMTCTLADIAGAAGWLLKYGGRLVIVHKPERLPDIFDAMKSVGIEPKRLLLSAPKQGTAPNMMVVEGIRGAAPGLKWEPLLLVHDDAGGYTQRMRDIFAMKDGEESNDPLQA